MLLYVDSNFASPYALPAYVSLIEKGLTFDVKPLELFANAQKADAFATTSITARVPTLAKSAGLHAAKSTRPVTQRRMPRRTPKIAALQR